MKTYSFKLNSFIFCLLIAFSACDNTTDSREGDAAAQDENMIGDANKRAMNVEEDFVTEAIEANAEELTLLRMGIKNGTDPEVKSQAQTMLTEHEKMNNFFISYARNNNIDLADIDTTENIDINEDKGTDWDEEWADEVSDLHKRMIRRFEKAEGRVQNAELKNQLSTSLPLMRNHLQTTDSLEKRLERKQ